MTSCLLPESKEVSDLPLVVEVGRLELWPTS